MKRLNYLVFSAFSLVLAGCGGGGNLDRFVSFSTTAPSSTSEMDAIGLISEYVVDMADGTVMAEAPEATDPDVRFTLDAGGAVTKASLRIPPPPGFGNFDGVSFNSANGDIFADGDTIDPVASDYFVATSANGDEAAIVADPIAAGFDFQSFGIWANGINGGAGSVGAASAGAPTAASGIPVIGDAFYDGMSVGFFIDPDGEAYIAFADFDAFVDFVDLDIILSSSGTDVIPFFGGASVAMPSLDYAGAGDVGADGSFSVAIVAVDMAGVMDGRLYGPTAEELGGVFAMEGDAGQYFGAVGAAQ